MLGSTAFRGIGLAIVAAALAPGGAFADPFQCGTASFYHEDYLTATGEHYKADGISAAHRTLPLGTVVRVRSQVNGREVVVRINDRGPYIKGRIIDLSRGAKRVIGMDGLAPVCVTILGQIDRKAMVKFASADERMATDAKRQTASAKTDKKRQVARLDRAPSRAAATPADM